MEVELRWNSDQDRYADLLAAKDFLVAGLVSLQPKRGSPESTVVQIVEAALDGIARGHLLPALVDGIAAGYVPSEESPFLAFRSQVIAAVSAEVEQAKAGL